jgi:hypothetical protein
MGNGSGYIRRDGPYGQLVAPVGTTVRLGLLAGGFRERILSATVDDLSFSVDDNELRFPIKPGIQTVTIISGSAHRDLELHELTDHGSHFLLSVGDVSVVEIVGE